MSCKSTRERMMELDPSQFDKLEHLQGCQECTDFGHEIRLVEAEMGQHVANFEGDGDFDAAWADAQEDVEVTQEVANPWAHWFRFSIPLQIAAAIMLVVFSLPDQHGPQPGKPAPVAAHPPAMTPRPAPIPVAAPPRPASPRPVASPARRPSRPEGNTVVVTGLPELATGIELKCADGQRLRGAASHRRAEVRHVPGVECQVNALGVDASGVVTGSATLSYQGPGEGGLR